MVAHACNPSYLEGLGRRMTWTEGEVTVSQDHATVLQPGQQSDSVWKKKKKLEEKTAAVWKTTEKQRHWGHKAKGRRLYKQHLTASR